MINITSIRNILAVGLLTAALFGCQKKDSEPVATQLEVVFSATEVTPTGLLKSTEEWECKDLPADYARILIDGITYFTEVYRLNGVLYTQAIKLDIPPGGSSKTYEVSGFFLMHDGGTKGNYEDNEEIVMATPSTAGPFKEYVADPVTLEITVNSFEKIEIPIEVLCFQESLYDGFGFDWFAINEIVIREQCFFGDICADNPEEWVNSLYGSQQFGPQIDMPAIFYIDVTVNGEPVPYSPFGNALWFGEGAPLCVQYPDDLNVDGEEFLLELYVLIPDNGGFSYVKYLEWTLVDDEMIPHGGDGIVDFVIGDCTYEPPDIPIDPDVFEPPIEPVCETAFAFGGLFANCFLDYDFNRWGWSNGLLSEGTYEFPIYAGAGQCDLDNGTLVGDLDVVYSGGNVTVTYNIPDPDLALYAIHIYVGNGMFPLKNGNPTVAPGQYPWIEEIPEGVSTYNHTFTGLSGPIYVIAHGVVCGNYN